MIRDEELVKMAGDEQRKYIEEWYKYMEDHGAEYSADSVKELMDILQKQHDMIASLDMEKSIGELEGIKAPDYIEDSELEDMSDSEINKYFKKWSQFMRAAEEEFGEDKSESLKKVLNTIHSQMVAYM